jgi:hypothetical protein
MISGKKKYPSTLTKLVGFRGVGGKTIAIKIIAVAVIRKWSSGKITGLRKSTKKVLTDAIVQYRAGKEHQQVHGSLEVTIPGTDQVLVINVKRFMNVMFGSIIKPPWLAHSVHSTDSAH